MLMADLDAGEALSSTLAADSAMRTVCRRRDESRNWIGDQGAERGMHGCDQNLTVTALNLDTREIPPAIEVGLIAVREFSTACFLLVVQQHPLPMEGRRIHDGSSLRNG
jgi:hypothetical protein